MKRGNPAQLVSLALVLLAATPAGEAGAQEPGWHVPEHGGQTYWMVNIDQFEWTSSHEDSLAWDVESWIGGDYNRFWLKTEGDAPAEQQADVEIQALYSRLVSPFWDAMAGVRYDYESHLGLSRAHVVVGMKGLAPYWWHLEPSVFLSQDGDLTARLEGSYDLLVTQRLVLQPEFELDVAAQTNEQWGEGSGLMNLSLAARLRYELRREIAPYLGVEWAQRFGKTADFARARGESVADTHLLVGLRAWF